MRKYINLNHFVQYMAAVYTDTASNLTFIPKAPNKMIITTKIRGKNNLPSQMFIINRTSKNVYKIVYLDNECVFFGKCHKAQMIADYINNKYLLNKNKNE